MDAIIAARSIHQLHGRTIILLTFTCANGLGDLLFTLVCGHEVHRVFRDLQGFTPTRITHALATGQIRFDQPQRCYVCGALERERGREQAP